MMISKKQNQTLIAEHEEQVPERDTPSKTQFGKTVAANTEENMFEEEMESRWRTQISIWERQNQSSAEPRKTRLLSSLNIKEKMNRQTRSKIRFFIAIRQDSYKYEGHRPPSLI
jgi:hypothetical protein